MSKNEQQNLFSTEEMNNMIPGAMQFQEDQPVICLGREFPNDEARREYFREELRKKLPELRQIEGFPIGSDDDIIRLSDLPYYTACPNPWLNDFIAEWEKEKEQLEAEGKRKADFEVKEPYASDVSEGRNDPIYLAHSYHTKCPHTAIMRYIMHYTQPGDIVFDGFAGTGMSGVAAQTCENPEIAIKQSIEQISKELGYNHPMWGKRYSILGDLSPIASFIGSNYNSTVDEKSFALKANNILQEVKKECGWMFETNYVDEKGVAQIGTIVFTLWSDVYICPVCGNEMVFWDVAVDEENCVVKEHFNCPKCNVQVGKSTAKKAKDTKYDILGNQTINQIRKVPVLM